MPVLKPDKVLLLIDLGGIEFIGNYDTGKSEPGFQVKSSGLTTLHKCSDDQTVQNWVDKVMTAKLGPSKPESDPEDSLDSNASDEASSSGEEPVKPSPEAARKLAKSEDKSKAKLKSSAGASSKSKSKSSKTDSGSKSSKSKSKKTKDKDSKKSKHGSSKENGKRDEDAGKSPKRSKSTSSSDSYVPQWAAHYNGIKQQERQKYFEGLSTQELVKLVSGGLEQEANAAKERVLQEWATSKRTKLLELHAVELADLHKKQQRELDDISKRTKEFMEA